MKKKVSPEVKKIITQSEIEALRLGHDYIGTEHLLLGGFNKPLSIAVMVLISLGVDIRELREVIKGSSQKDKMANAELKVGVLSLNTHAEKALKTMSLEAQVSKNTEVCPEHLLLAILKYPENLGAKILNSLGVGYDRYKTEIEYVRLKIQEEAPLAPSPYGSDEQRERKSKSRTPELDWFGRDITQFVKENRQYATVGREAEIQKIAQILSKKENKNVLLIGESGVGKRAIIEEFAHRIQNNMIYRRHYNRIIELDWTKLLIDTKYRGELERRIKAILSELKRYPKTILLLNQMHVAFKKMSRNGIDITDMLKPALYYGELKFIGIIAADKYPLLMADRAMNNYFHKLFIQPSTPKQAMLMLESAKSKYEAFHNVTYGKDTLKTCIQLTHLRGEVLPGKAISLLDEVAAQVRMNNMSNVPGYITELEQKIGSLVEQKDQAVKAEKYEYAADLRDDEAKLIKELELQEASWLKKIEATHFTIEKKDVEELFAPITEPQQPEKK